MPLRALILGLLTLAACAHTSQTPTLRSEAWPTAVRIELEEIEDEVLRAESPEDVRQGVAKALALAPTSAQAHDLAARLARLDADLEGEIEHLLLAAADLEAPDPLDILYRLQRSSMTQAQRGVWIGLLARLALVHPSPVVRARALADQAAALWLDGCWEKAKTLAERLRPGFEWRVIGAFDNDQGKGFDEVLPPETGLALDDAYDGALLEVRWRKRPVEPPVGPAIDFGSIMSPARWVVAYAVTSFEVAESGPLELRVRSPVAVKAWVDGVQVLSERTVTGGGRDPFVVRLEIAPGRHRLLLKSAQDTGSWWADVRWTEVGGGETQRIQPLVADAAPTGGVGRRDAGRPAPARARPGALRAALARAERQGLRLEALRLAGSLVALAPRSILLRRRAALTAWRHEEVGRATDLLESLAEQHGRAFPRLLLDRARFLTGRGFSDEALALLEQAVRAPAAARAAVASTRADYFERQRWTEDRCRAWSAAIEARPGWVRARRERANCLAALGFRREADELRRSLVARFPGSTATWARLLGSDRESGDLDAARADGAAWLRAAPHRTSPRLALADVARRQGDLAEAKRHLDRAIALDPDNPRPWSQLAKVHYQGNEESAAIAAWRSSLERNPDDDATARRLEWLAPSDEGPWRADIPDEARVQAALALRSRERVRGAHTRTLLDHEVTVAKADGSTTEVVTLIVQALDDSGRDQLTKIDLRRGGHLRILKAYALDEDGTRRQASSIRRRTARFRNLAVGSAVVIQYRHEGKPPPFLSRHLARGWWFQGNAAFVHSSEWILWRPAGANLHEWLKDPQGRVQREVRRDGDFERVAWRAQGIPPLDVEPSMPTAREVGTNLLVSTVPDWSTFLQWEKALMTGVFRTDPQLQELAQRIVGDAASPREKALRLHAWLMAQIRYQQDYEDHIAGVRPHPAPVVLERSYGDCKDKSVLFIAMARHVGLEARFALLRTRPKGPLLQEIPMQQFDHAIVYVPEQPGLERGFFVDSTADALDLEALRSDDVGTRALVFDPSVSSHEWRDIPFRGPEENGRSLALQLDIDASGGASGTVDLEGWGSTGSALRRLARNAQRLEQAAKGMTGRLLRGANVRKVEAIEVKDLRAPAHLRMSVAVPGLLRREAGDLRLRVPPAWNPRGLFSLETRKHPLVLGVPSVIHWTATFSLPRELRVRRLPPAVKVNARCFSFIRKSRRSGAQIEVTQSFSSTCERVDVEAYAEHRAQAEAVMKALEDEVVLRRR